MLNQVRVHDFWLDVMARLGRGMVPFYSRRLVDVKMAAESDESVAMSEYPVEVKLERLDEAHKGEIETMRARYVVGCEGARSTVRQSLGLSLKGDCESSLGRDGRSCSHRFSGL